jgi:molecular chaperone HscB
MTVTSYFELLKLPVIFDINLADLDKNYFSLQVEFHPDKATDDKQKQQFMLMSTQINAAYENLKDELKRAQVLLEISGINLEDEKARKSLSVEFLQDIWSEFEIIQDLEDGGKLSEMLANKYLQKKEIVDLLNKAFSAKNTENSLKLTMSLKYVDNLIGQIKQKLQLKSIRT